MTSQKEPKILLILSGKGGVGKSTVSKSIALELLSRSFKVGILDLDLTGPSIPTIFNVTNGVIHQGSAGWVPVDVALKIQKQQKASFTDTVSGVYNEKENETTANIMTKHIKLISVGFLVAKDAPVIWRGPKKSSMIKQLLQDVDWGADLDYLVIDTPPGTSDEHITMATCLQERDTGLEFISAILVTTPQSISLVDVSREYDFCVKTGINVTGVIENMSGFLCPCGCVSDVFSKGGGEMLAEKRGCRFLGRIPIELKKASNIQQNDSIHGDIQQNDSIQETNNIQENHDIKHETIPVEIVPKGIAEIVDQLL